MIGLSKNGRFLDLSANTRLTVELDSPLFSNEAIPGLKVFNFDIPKSKHNLRELGFSSGLSNSVPDQKLLEKYILHVGNNGLSPYKQGYLKHKGGDRKTLSYSFHSGAGEINLQIKGKKLNELTFDSYVNEYEYGAIYPEKNHTYVSMFNEDRNGNDDGGNPTFINDFTASNISTVEGILIPFPFLCYVVKKIFQQLGFFNVVGSWFEDERIRRIVIFNNYQALFVRLYANHLPDLSVGDFLVSLKNMFSLAISFDSATSTVRLDWKKDVVSNTASKDFTGSASENYKFIPNDTDGFTLSMAADGNDKLTAESSVPFEYKIGNGKDPVSTNASSIYEKHLSIFLKIKQALGSEMTLGKKPFGLRLMFYVGHKSFLGKSYPAGDYEYGGLSLAWDGENGLYNQAHKPWLDMLAETYSLDRTINFNLPELLSLNMNQKVMIQYNKFLFSKVRFTAGTGKQKIWSASTTMYRSKY